VQSEPEKLKDAKEKQPYQKPELRKHGSVEQLTGFQIGASGFDRCDTDDPCDVGV
jgi:hypothetical protein